MSLNDAGSWASIIGFVLTVLTFLLAARVNAKVNRILKSRQDKAYFQKRADKTLQNLRELKMMAEDDNKELLFTMNQYARLNDAMELASSSWDVLMEYEHRFFRKIKIHSWEKKFQDVRGMYRNERVKSVEEMIRFLGEMITFFEKEMSSYEG